MIHDLSANTITIVVHNGSHEPSWAGVSLESCLDSGSNVHNDVSSYVMIRSGSLRCRQRNAVDSQTPRFRSSSVRSLGTHLADTRDTYAKFIKNAPHCSITANGRLHNLFNGLPPIFIKARVDVIIPL
jgi:hypothetical protein